LTSGSIIIGSEASGESPTVSPKKRGGATPMIVKNVLWIWTLFPIIEASRPKRFFQ